MLPGETTLTRMLCGGEFGGQRPRQPDQAHFRRRDMGAPAAAGEGDPSPVKNRIRPYLFLTIDGITARVQWIAPSRTTPRTASQSSSVTSVKGLCGRIAALLIRMSTRPNSDIARADHRVDLILLGDVGDDRQRLDPAVAGFARDTRRPRPGWCAR